MKPRTLAVVTILVSVLAFGLSGAHAQTVLYVDDDAPPGGDGTSWFSPFKYLQDGLAAASSDPSVSEIRVACGVYKPDQDEGGTVTLGNREATRARLPLIPMNETQRLSVPLSAGTSTATIPIFPDTVTVALLTSPADATMQLALMRSVPRIRAVARISGLHPVVLARSTICASISVRPPERTATTS